MSSTARNVTSAQVEVKRVHSDSIFFVRLGYGYASGPGNGGGPSLGLGWRKELNRVALDLAFVNVLILSNAKDANGYSSDELDGGSFTPVALGVNYHFRPLSNGTPYAGLGVGFTVWDPDGDGGEGSRRPGEPRLRDVPGEHRAPVRAGGRDPGHLRGDAQDVGSDWTDELRGTLTGLRPSPSPSGSASGAARDDD